MWCRFQALEVAGLGSSPRSVTEVPKQLTEAPAANGAGENRAPQRHTPSQHILAGSKAHKRVPTYLEAVRPTYSHLFSEPMSPSIPPAGGHGHRDLSTCTKGCPPHVRGLKMSAHTGQRTPGVAIQKQSSPPCPAPRPCPCPPSALPPAPSVSFLPRAGGCLQVRATG